MKVGVHVGIARILKEESVEWTSTFPLTKFNNACGQEGITNLMMRDERFAVAVADGFSRVSDGKRFGVCTVQGGFNSPGIHCAYPALAQAFEDSTPLLCMTDSQQTSIEGTKSYNQLAAFESVVKWSCYINRPHRAPEFMMRAFTYLRSGTPGPVLVHVPLDLGEYDDSEYLYTPPKGWKYSGDPKDVNIAVRALLAAKRPLIYAGQGIFYADACDDLLEFAELLQIPVLTTLKGKSCFPENHPLSAGVNGTTAERLLSTSDLVFALGCSLLPGARYGGFRHQIPDARCGDFVPTSTHKTIIQCTTNSMDINRYCQADHAILGDAKLVLQQLIALVKEETGSVKPRRYLEEIEKAKKDDMEKFMPLMTSNEKPINPYRVYWDLMNTIDRKNSFVTHDSGYTREQLVTAYEAQIPHGFMGWGNVSTLGFGLGAAIGARLAFPVREIVNVAGDAAIGYQMGNYEALVRNRIGITTIHINNSGFSGYGPGFWGEGRAPYTADVTSSSTLNMAKTVEGLGEYAERIENPDDFVPALKRALRENKKSKPAFLEVICSKHPVAGTWLSR